MAKMFDFLIVGGGLGGISAALRLSKNLGRAAAIGLLDDPLPEAAGALGGFAKFSGAKFSLPPAGMGLLPLVGGDEIALGHAYSETLALLTLPKAELRPSADLPLGRGGLALRRYESILLSPPELERLIKGTENAVYSAGVQVIKARAIALIGAAGGWNIQVQTGGSAISQLSATRVIIATGRLGGDILKRAGAVPQQGKGIDLGVRVEFEGLDAVTRLRELGPDAKVLHGPARTFCLNAPGHIFRYQADGMRIAGGIVAEPGHGRANFGLMARIDDKANATRALRATIGQIPHVVEVDDGTAFGAAGKAIETLYGVQVASSLVKLADVLGSEGLVNWRRPHRVHIPLIDWHWDVFALPGGFESSLPGVYAIGDVGGHARGLLQAAVSGHLVANWS